MSEEGKLDLSALSGKDLQSAVDSILADPAFGKILAEVSGRTQPPEAAADTPPQPAVPQITPEMMARLPQMMSALMPLVSGMTGDKKESGEKKGSDGDSEKRKKLLAALKPYLSSSRQDAIDSIMKVTEMTDLIGQLGSLKPGAADNQPK